MPHYLLPPPDFTNEPFYQPIYLRYRVYLEHLNAYLIPTYAL
jgi:hypothetical protein